MEQMDTETMMRTWLPVGMQGLEQIQKMFWSRLAGAADPRGGHPCGAGSTRTRTRYLPRA